MGWWEIFIIFVSILLIGFILDQYLMSRLYNLSFSILYCFVQCIKQNVHTRIMSLPSAEELQRHTLPKTQDYNKLLAVTGIDQENNIYFT